MLTLPPVHRPPLCCGNDNNNAVPVCPNVRYDLELRLGKLLLRLAESES